MHIIFVARKFPPFRGGMERVAKQLFDSLSEQETVFLIKPKSNTRTPLSVPIVFIKLLTQVILHRPDVIYLQDGMLSPLVVLGKIFRIPVVIQVHGLDVTYNKFGYQKIVIPFLRLADKISSVSEATKTECVIRGISESRIFVLPNGVDFDFWEGVLKANGENETDYCIPQSNYILSVGRLIERKGFGWFIQNVFPIILSQDDSIKYVIVGEGPYRSKIEQIIEDAGCKDKVILTGSINNNHLVQLYLGAKVFVSPNIQVNGDKEGFGIANLEATFFGIPVIASNVDGIPDAIVEGVTGKLVEAYDSKEFADCVLSIIDGKLNFDKDQMNIILKTRYCWDAISGSLTREFRRI